MDYEDIAFGAKRAILADLPIDAIVVTGTSPNASFNSEELSAFEPVILENRKKRAIRKTVSDSEEVIFDKRIVAQSATPLGEDVTAWPMRKQISKRTRDYDEVVSPSKKARVEISGPKIMEPQTTSPSRDLPLNGEELGEAQTVILKNGCIYIGQLKNGKFHGQGQIFAPNHVSYAGQFIEGSITRGVKRYPNGETYEGQFERGKFQGQGIFAYPNGIRYEGQFVNGVRQGYGIVFKKDKKIYEGNFFKDKFEGLGRMNYSNGNQYMGQWAKGKFHGQGTLDFANGQPSLIGLFVQGEFLAPAPVSSNYEQKTKIKITFS
jgi:hypothetical protein